MAHATSPTVALRTGPVHFSGKSYSDRFECPRCGRARRLNLNFLGSKVLVCDGEKFHRVATEWRDGKQYISVAFMTHLRVPNRAH